MEHDNKQIAFSQRLREFRQRTMMEPHELASGVGISLSCYYDLETTGDLPMILSLAQVTRMCALLGQRPDHLFRTECAQPTSGTSIEQLLMGLEEYQRRTGRTWQEVDNLVGYNVSGTRTREAALAQWNIDALRAVCRQLGCDWLDVLASLA